MPSVTEIPSSILVSFLQNFLFLIAKSPGIFTAIFSSISNNLPAYVCGAGCSRQLPPLTLGRFHLFHLKFFFFFTLKFVPMTAKELCSCVFEQQKDYSSRTSTSLGSSLNFSITLLKIFKKYSHSFAAVKTASLHWTSYLRERVTLYGTVY